MAKGKLHYAVIDGAPAKFVQRFQLFGIDHFWFFLVIPKFTLRFIPKFRSLRVR